ncbi:hypothetical protein TRVL_01001 [Trypanosoma vivax]|uniref:Dynein regulatory complex protein 12 n=1 Tax=Trypanosoma vivax (strain Y486) TaxID=1055687 RepID=G0U1I4_TRYVY|nr:hypothetical protein TRVL_01001 [Trypanosoma vivax]CCC49941.1 conserved hypothetical protein [Trypanosoma vivax Y486]
MPPKEIRKTQKSDVEMPDEEMQLNDDIIKASLRLSALKAVHAERMEEIVMLKREREKLSAACAVSEAEASAATTDRFDILTDFARQYRTDESARISVATKLDALFNDLCEEKIKLNNELKRTETEYDEALSAARAECEALSSRIADMEKEFDIIINDTESTGHKVEPCTTECV